VCHAKLIKKIKSDSISGVQGGLNELAKLPDFIAALQTEIDARQLILENITPRLSSIYNTTAKRSNGNDLVITLYEYRYTQAECALLATFLQLQSGWPNGFEWEQVKRKSPTQN